VALLIYNQSITNLIFCEVCEVAHHFIMKCQSTRLTIWNLAPHILFDSNILAKKSRHTECIIREATELSSILTT